jgi:hypothetical protein
MAKLTQAEVKAKADEWALINKKIEKLEASKTEELVEFQIQYQASIAEITDAYDPKINPLRDKAKAIETEVIAWLKDLNKPIALCAQFAEAVNEKKDGDRVVDAKKFFALAKDKFWSCVTVGVKKAEEAIGKEELNKICTKPSTIKSSLRLK